MFKIHIPKAVILFYISVIFGCNSTAQIKKNESVSAIKPNVLFIVADDMNTYAFLKNYPVLKTPALDKLVSQSYYFKNATCAAPACIPLDMNTIITS
jgi:arylsulfatase A-like enzyme